MVTFSHKLRELDTQSRYSDLYLPGCSTPGALQQGGKMEGLELLGES